MSLNTRLLCSEVSHSSQNVYVFDAKSGSIHRYYHGSNIIAARSTAVLSGEYIIAAEKSKPTIHFWPINSQATILKSTTPGLVTRLITSQCGLFLIVAIDNKVYIWQINTGQLLAKIDQNLRKITSLALTDDDCYLITGSEDGLIYVFDLNYYITIKTNVSQRILTLLNNLKPIYELNEHVAAITDIFVSGGGLEALLLSTSSDKTLKITSLSNGIVQLSIAFPEEPRVITLKNTKDQAFCGLVNGDIYPINLYDPPRTREFYINDVNQMVFKGHSSAILCLLILRDYQTLVSTSDDKLIIFWDMLTGQKLKTIEKKAPVNNLIIDFKCNFNNDCKEFNLVLKPLSKLLRKDTDPVCIDLCIDNKINQSLNKRFANELAKLNPNCEKQNENEEVNNENKKLRIINKRLYLFNLRNILNNANNEQLTIRKVT